MVAASVQQIVVKSLILFFEQFEVFLVRIIKVESH